MIGMPGTSMNSRPVRYAVRPSTEPTAALSMKEIEELFLLIEFLKEEGKAIVPKSAADSIEAGIVYVPEERGKQGVVIGLPIFQNVSLPSLKRTSKSGMLRLSEEFSLARSYTERLDLRASSLSQDVGTLSGGNQQKVVLAKCWTPCMPTISTPMRG